MQKVEETIMSSAAMTVGIGVVILGAIGFGIYKFIKYRRRPK